MCISLIGALISMSRKEWKEEISSLILQLIWLCNIFFRNGLKEESRKVKNVFIPLAALELCLFFFFSF